MKIAIILPVYNVENRLAICLDSIFKQTYRDFVVVAINDGSTDKSLEILNSYKNDKRLIIINQNNQGLSAARNRGLQEITSDNSIDIITFIDSDDRIETNYLEHCITTFKNNNIDCYLSGYFEETNTIINKTVPKILGFFSNTKVIKLLCDGTMPVTVCGKFYKASICKNMKYPNFNPGEDFCGNIQVLLKTTKNVYIDNYCGYYYFRDSAQPSITRSKRDFKKRMNHINSFIFVYKISPTQDIKNILKKRIVDCYFHELPYFVCVKLNANEKSELNRFKKWAKDNLIFKDSKNKFLILYKYFRPLYFCFIKIKYSKYYK